MNGNTYPIGSVVKINNFKAIIIGMNFDKVNDKLVKSYLIAAYPIGFTGEEYIRLVSADQAELISEGYRAPETEVYLELMDHIDAIADIAGAGAAKKAFDDAIIDAKGGRAQ